MKNKLLVMVVLAAGLAWCGILPAGSRPCRAGAVTPSGRIFRQIDYDERSGVLTVRFASGHGYEYLDVPRDRARGLLAAAGKGAYYNDWIRGQYAFRRCGGKARSGRPDQP